MKVHLLMLTTLSVLVIESGLCAQEVPPTATLKGHDSTVRTLAFTADGKTLASSGELTGLKLWDTTTGKERARSAVPNYPDAGCGIHGRRQDIDFSGRKP